MPSHVTISVLKSSFRFKDLKNGIPKTISCLPLAFSSTVASTVAVRDLQNSGSCTLNLALEFETFVL